MAPWYSGKSCRLLCMICLTTSFFVVEITVGYITNSLALVGDSYHMLSDVLALFVGFASVKVGFNCIFIMTLEVHEVVYVVAILDKP